MRLSRVVIISCALCSLIGVPKAASRPPSGPQSRIEKGISVVRNSRKPAGVPGRAGTLHLVHELTIGRGDDENCQFGELRSAQIDSEGHIYALDGKDCAIKVFDPDGRYLRTIGKEGQGPGELSFPSRIILTPQDDVVVLDGGNRRLSFFKKDGTLIRELSTAKWSLGRFRMNGRGEIYADVLAPSGEGGIVWNLTKFSPDLSASTVLASEPRSMTPNRVVAFPPGFAHGSTRDGGLAWAVDSRYEITVVGPDGKPRLRIVKDPEPNPIREQDRKALMEEEYKGIPAGITVDIPSHYPPIRTLVVTDTDHILIRTYVKDGKGGIINDVFDPEGRFVAQFSLGPEEFSMQARDGRLLTLVREDAEGIPLLIRYGLVWE